jgi:hypothetical protein
MTAYDLVRIKNSNLNSNNYVNLQGVHFNPGNWKKKVNAPGVDGQFSGTSYKIGKGDQVGIENPSISVVGVISTADFASNNQLWSVTPSTASHNAEDGSSMANMVTLGYLNALWRDMTGTVYVKISFGHNPDSQFNWYDYDLQNTDIEVMVSNIQITPRQDSDGNHFFDYTIELIEVEN